ncbi:MAG: hypothetical protein DMF92_20880, partial [Acidobacteria bacterium]
ERPDATAELTQWDPDTPYLTKISEASPRDRYRAYLGQRTKYSRSPAFYLDLADFFLSHGDRVLGRRLLTNVVELDPDDVHLLRVAAHRLQSSGELQLATMLFEKVRSLLRFDLQARRDLALALTELADRRRAKIGRFDSVVIADYQRAMRLHREILTGRWDGWFNQSHILALTDLNRIIAMLRENGIAAGREFQLDPRLVRPIDADLRVVLTWDDDAVDLNLIIQKPNGEGSSPIFDARTGGVHVDSSGYGPAEYVERKALKGRYEIDVIYVDTSGRALLGPTTARATIFTNFGRPAERSRQVKVRLVNERDDYVLGTVRQ